MDDRREDWRSGVDQNLVALNTAQRVTDQQLDDLDLKYEALDKVLRGDAESDTDGLIARFHHQENLLLELKADIRDLRLDIMGGRVGESGLKQRIQNLESGIPVKGFKWEFLTKVTVQALILLGLLILGWDKVAELVKRVIRQRQPFLEENIEKGRHPKGKTLYRVRHVPEPVPSDDTKE